MKGAHVQYPPDAIAQARSHDFLRHLHVRLVKIAMENTYQINDRIHAH